MESSGWVGCGSARAGRTRRASPPQSVGIFLTADGPLFCTLSCRSPSMQMQIPPIQPGTQIQQQNKNLQPGKNQSKMVKKQKEDQNHETVGSASANVAPNLAVVLRVAPQSDCSGALSTGGTLISAQGAAAGLGFFNINLPKGSARELSIKNVGVVYVEAGSVNKEELASGLTAIYKTNCPWQTRELDEWTYLVKFPPHIKVDEVAGYPCFGLPKEGVSVNVMVWEGGIDYFADLQEVWVQVRGLQPQWCKWPILYQFASALGILLEVDWQGMFQSFFEVVRIKIQCKDHTMIPTVRNFNVLGKLYQIGFTVEGPTPVVAVDDGDDGHQPPHNSEEDSNGQKGSNGEDMDTDKKLEKSAPTPSGLKPAVVKGSSTGAPSSSSLAGLSTKVHEVASAFIEKRNCFQSASKLSPLENEGMEKKKVIDWINARGEDEDSCANLLREMELVQEVDEEIFFLENDKGQSLPIVQGQDAQDKLVSKSSKQWGSVFNTRQSARVLNTGQTVLQMAQQVQKKKNLECPIPAASKLKGLEACPVLDQEVEADLQRSHDGERGSFLSSHLPPASGPLTTDSWLRRQD